MSRSYTFQEGPSHTPGFLPPGYALNQTMSPYPQTPPGYRFPAPPNAKKSISFLGLSELCHYRALPITGALTYLASSLPTVADQETFVR